MGNHDNIMGHPVGHIMGCLMGLPWNSLQESENVHPRAKLHGGVIGAFRLKKGPH